MSEKIKRIVPDLLDWFAANARDLPWRRTRDPYAIWVSEIMLQQTQVKTVIPYWERWMKTLPTLQNLAAAEPELIHKLWEGLGYYTRVRNLQKAAQHIVTHYDSQFPREFAAILELPGIGRYTAGAISSIAFNQPQPILDGNVMRVLTRLFGITENPREKNTNQLLWQLAEKLVQTAASLKEKKFPACSHLNQALMELGALICVPQQPKCLVCPAQKNCAAFKTGRTHEIPNLAARAAVTARHFVAVAIENRGRYLVKQRPAGVVNAHLWEFPNVEIAAEISDPAGFARDSFGLPLTEMAELCVIKHSITRYRITLQAFLAKTNSKLAASPKSENSSSLWLPLEELDALPFTSAHRKILRRLMALR